MMNATASVNSESNKKEKESSISYRNVFKFIEAFIIGLVFGLAMEKARVYEPLAIRQQMIFKNFTMIKMFLSALATSTLSILFISKLFPGLYDSILNAYRDSVKNKSYLIIILGGSLIGIGMLISGACPGMVLVQVGAGVPNALLTLTGALAGTLVHGLINSYLMRNSKPDLVLSQTLYEVLNVDTSKFRLCVVVGLSSIVFALELFLPWSDSTATTNIWAYKSWPPFVCGILLGSLQLFTILLLNKSLGASSAYSTLVGVSFCTKELKECNPYFAKFREGLSNWLTVMHIFGAICGGFISAKLSGEYGKSIGVHPYNALLGGFIMVFGARIAGGCTSGHGISGSSYQFLASLLAVVAMFGSAILTGYFAYTNDFFL